MSNSLGDIFNITSFGESHGHCVGIVIDGCPAGLSLSETDIQKELDRRRPGREISSTSRQEEDQVEIISGVFNGMTTGAPLTMLVWNKDTDSSQYEKTRHLLRPGHADYTARLRYGGFNDYRGGGRFSGRITAGFVMAGAVAKKLLETAGISVLAHTVAIGGIEASPADIETIKSSSESNALRCADTAAAAEMTKAVENARSAGDSLGGVIEGIALNVPAGLGEPIFGSIEGEMSRAIFAIPAVKGVEFGAGFSAAVKKGSENNDPFRMEGDKIVTASNNAGGILGGISSGMPITVRVAVKPTPSISQEQDTVDIDDGKEAKLGVRGRHDACIVPRAVPVVESMMAVTLCDLALKAGLIPRVLGQPGS